jgi:signal transduction histidine kinase
MMDRIPHPNQREAPVPAWLRSRPEATAWGIAGLGGLIGLGLLTQIAEIQPFAHRPFALPFWGVAVLYALAETTVIHLHSRRGAHALSLGEIGLVFGIATASPVGFVVGRILGVLAAHTVIRRVAPVKVAFNVGTNLVGSSLAVLIVHAVTSDLNATWPLLLVAAAVDGIIAAGTVAFIITVMNPHRTVTAMLREAAVSWIEGMTVAVLATVSFLLVGGSLTTAPLAGLMVFTLFRALKLYESLHRRNEELEALYAFTQEIEGAESIEGLVQTLMEEISRQLRSDQVTFVSHDIPGSWSVRTIDDDRFAERSIDASEALELVEWVTLDGRLIARHDDSLAIGAKRVEAPLVAAPVVAGDEVIGLIVASHRPGPDRAYDREDRMFLRALGRHGGALLGRLHAQRQLIGEINEKQQIIQSKDQLIAAVSHELRTPLTGILGFAEMLRDDGAQFDERAQRDMIKAIAAESLDLSNIVEDLLTAARFDRGGLATRSEFTRIDPLVERVVSTISDRRGRSIELQTSAATAMADAPRLRQVVRNLITNAIRYGGDRIVVRVASSDDHALIEVRDNGSQLKPTDAERIFEPYTSAHLPGSQPGSVGLGLTISLHLVRLMGGDLTFRREHGWTTFRIELPQAVAVVDAAPASQASLAG